MNKDLAQIKVYNYFSIKDAKTEVKLKDLLPIFGDFFCATCCKIFSKHQVTG